MKGQANWCTGHEWRLALMKVIPHRAIETEWDCVHCGAMLERPIEVTHIHSKVTPFQRFEETPVNRPSFVTFERMADLLTPYEALTLESLFTGSGAL